MTSFEDPRPNWPLRSAGQAAAGSFLIPFAVVFGAAWIRRRFEPGDDGWVMWWPFTGQQVAVVAFAGIALAVVLGVVVLLRRDGQWWPVVRWPWLIVTLFALALSAQALDSRVMVYADRIVTTGDGGPLRPGILTFDSAEWVEAHCHLIHQRRRPDIATLTYAVYFSDGQVAWLDQAHDRTRGDMLRWFHALEKLDRTALASVPHGPVGSTRSVQCIRTLRAELGETNFTAARRMLGISDGDFARRYAEPHEAFQR